MPSSEYPRLHFTADTLLSICRDTQLHLKAQLVWIDPKNLCPVQFSSRRPSDSRQCPCKGQWIILAYNVYMLQLDQCIVVQIDLQEGPSLRLEACKQPHALQANQLQDPAADKCRILVGFPPYVHAFKYMQPWFALHVMNAN